MDNKKEFLLLFSILLISAFFRLYNLESAPPGLYPDEAINGNQAILEPGKIFYPENNGREGLFINMVWLSFKILGIHIWSLRICPALIGTFTVLGLYLLTKEIFSKNLSIKGSFVSLSFARMAYLCIDTCLYVFGCCSFFESHQYLCG